jgi:hypothetical protein
VALRISVALVAAVALLGALSALWVALTPATDQTPLVGRTWADFAAQDPEVASIVARLLVVLGLLGAGFGTVAFIVAVIPHRHGKRWSWFALWLLPLTYGLVAARMLSGDYLVGWFYAGLAGMALIGLLLAVPRAGSFLGGRDERVEAHHRDSELDA